MRDSNSRKIHPSFCALVAVGLAVGSEQVQAEVPRAFTDPVEIDRAVAGFTGVAQGLPGGARQLADRRLRLTRCANPLSAAWHGTPGYTVSVSCPDPGGWRIFIALHRAVVPARAEKVVRRGDMLTIAVRGRGFSVQQQGEAAEAGAIGDWVKVRTGSGKNIVSARIERAGLAVIPQ